MKACTKCTKVKPLSAFYKKGKESHCKVCKKEHRLATPDVSKRSYLKYFHDISLEFYNELYAKQDGKCAICSKPQIEFTKALAVDHDHASRKIRGLLCGPCNRAIGLLKDNSNIVGKAFLYLQEHGK